MPASQTFATKGDATRWLVVVEADIARGRHVGLGAGRVTLRQWADQWLARPGKRANSVARDRQDLAVFMADLGDRSLASITSAHVQAAVDARGRAVSPATLTRDVAALRAALNAAVDADLIGRSPARKVALPRVRPPDRTLIEPADLIRLADAVPAAYRALILVGGVLGLRFSIRHRQRSRWTRARLADIVEKMQAHYARPAATPAPVAGYDPECLRIVFGEP